MIDAEFEAARIAYQRRDPVCWSWQIPDDLDHADPHRALATWHAGGCGICGGGSSGREVLDHDHRTGLVRGWLCRGCNRKEGSADDPTDVYARWRACPPAAMLGTLFRYVSPIRGHEVSNPNAWTGFTYLPEWAPDPHGWPHAITCGTAAIETLDGSLLLPCDHDHDALIAAALMSGGTVTG